MSGSTVLAIVVAVLVALAVVLLAVWLVRRRSGSRNLRENGERALARVIRVEAVGAPAGSPQVRCALAFQLEPLAGGRAFDRQATMTLPQHLVPRLGDVWPAWYRGTDPAAFEVEVPDPGNREQVGVFREFGLRHPGERTAGATDTGPGERATTGTTDTSPGEPASRQPPAQTPRPPAPTVAAGPPVDMPRVTGSSGPPAPHEDPVIELERLVRLHDNGALSDDEFAAAKAKYLRQ